MSNSRLKILHFLGDYCNDEIQESDFICTKGPFINDVASNGEGRGTPKMRCDAMGGGTWYVPSFDQRMRRFEEPKTRLS